MFGSLEVTRFGCIEHVRTQLSALHAFVGPNDSGKSTLLKVAGGVACECADAWLLAWTGTRQTQTLSTGAAKERRTALAGATSDVAGVLARVGVDKIAEDATSLRRWLERVQAMVAESPPNRS
ncbi:MAG: hypothetical protein IPK74_36295 [Deltaproteobacteria bacterium]|nr:hypothetical protein [Deltaproteobacteria bacterium]